MAEAISVMPDEVVVEGEETAEKSETLEEEEAELEVEEPEEAEEEKAAAPSLPPSDDLKRVARLLEEDIQDRRSQKGKEKEEKKGEQELTDDQLVKVIEQYKDNPTILLQVFKHVAKETALGIKDATVKEERQRTWVESTRNTAMNVLKDEFGKLGAEDQAGMREALPGLIDSLGLGDHPAGPLAAFAIVRMAQLGEKPKAGPAGKVEKPKGQVDKTRKAPGSEEKVGGRLTAEEREVMAALGVKDPKMYLKFKGQGA